MSVFNSQGFKLRVRYLRNNHRKKKSRLKFHCRCLINLKTYTRTIPNIQNISTVAQRHSAVMLLDKLSLRGLKQTLIQTLLTLTLNHSFFFALSARTLLARVLRTAHAQNPHTQTPQVCQFSHLTWSSAADLSCFAFVSRRSFSMRWARSVMDAIAASLTSNENKERKEMERLFIKSSGVDCCLHLNRKEESLMSEVIENRSILHW